jgi:carboxypeptidase C (cathepsin A)
LVTRPLQCLEAEAVMEAEIGNVNPYALDYPVCLDALKAPGRMQRAWFLRHTLPEYRKEKLGLGDTYNYEPCTDNYMNQYLNQKDVQFAIHAQYKVWTECSYTLKYNMTDSQQPMEPVYQWLLANSNIQIMVYSGDDDSVCSTQGTQYWIYDLGYPISLHWHSWTDANGQVGGYLTKFANSTGRGYTFATIRSAGHEVPTYAPERALTVFSNFLAGKW